MVARIGFAIVLAISAVCTQAHAARTRHADDDESGREEAEHAAKEAAEQNTKEVAHEVSVSLSREPGVALFRVTRTFEARARSAPISIDGMFEVPDKAVVTSFAIRTDAHWRRGVLKRDDPTRPRHGRPQLPRKGQPWAILDWGGSQRMSIETPVFRADGRVKVRYTIWAKGEPTEAGHRWAYCQYDREDEAPPFEVLPSASETALKIHPDAKESACREIESREPPRTKLTTRFGSFDLGNDIWVWRAELVAPVSLGSAPLPRDPFPAVFVLDASHSQERQGGLGTQLAIVKAYLANVPKAEVELVLVGRDAQRLFGRLVPATEIAEAFPAGLAQRPLGNGSFLDRGAAVAADLLARDGRPGRVVVFTDDELRAAFDVKNVTATPRRAPLGTTVDFIYPIVSSHGDGISRIGWDRPEQIANAFGSGYYRAYVRTPAATGSPELMTKMRALLVPDAIQLIVMESADRGRDDWPGESTIGTVVAGHEVVLEGRASTPPPRSAAMTGWLGGKQLTFPFRPDPAMQRQVPRLIDPHADFRPCEAESPHLRAAGMRDGFLTMGLRFWIPGAGAATPRGSGFQLSDPCLNSTRLDLVGAREVKRDELPAALPEAARRCGGVLRARLETQSNEILEVSIEGGVDESRRCAAEAIWSFSLPATFNQKHPKRETYEVALQATTP